MATSTIENPSSTHTRPPFYRDVIIVKWLAQVAVLAAVVAAMLFFANEAGTNLKDKGIDTGFGFINQSAGFDISEGIDTNPATGGRALWVGMVNTLRISAAGLITATILGVLIGIARLSNNWLVNKISSIYVETFRNIPLLAQIIVWSLVIGNLSELVVGAGPIDGWFIISQKGVSVPRIFPWEGFYQWLIWLAIGAAAAAYVHHRRMLLRDEQGGDTRPFLLALGAFLPFAIIGWFAHPVFSWVGSIFAAIASVFDALPEALIQLILASVIIAIAAIWIRRFLGSFVTPAGRAKMTDDDIFRVVFAGAIALAVVVLVVIWPGLSSWIGNSGRDLFEVLDSKFSSDRTGAPLDATRPQVVVPGRFPQLGPTGLNITPAFLAIFVGVSIYTASFIAEIVRGGILAVDKGQTEAAMALGLRRSQMLRQVILPQAFRIILPPMGNQYLNLVKNTSLGLAVAYADVVNTGSTLINQSGKALQVILIWMLFYLSCSLTISVIVNAFNNRMRIMER
ncbi:MAG: ABC transporter permease subunit [Actinomycetia bacterium]|nr:ABC transporter permease subunit [Actinomycetes bacterium]